MSADSNASILFDAAGKPLAVTPATVLPSAQSSILVSGCDYAATPGAQAVKVDNVGNVWTLNSDLGPGSATAAMHLRTPLLNGTSQNMVVNGSSTNQTFKWAAASTTASYVITGLAFVMTTSALGFKGIYFGTNQATLANGILAQATIGGVARQLANIKINEDFLSFSGPVVISTSGATDALTARLLFRQPINAGSGDSISVVIRDNLTTSGTVYYLSAYVSGMQFTT